MSVYEAKKNQQDLEHARWRVEFQKSMLASHRLLPWKSEDWKRKESDILDRLAKAEGDLKEMSGA